MSQIVTNYIPPQISISIAPITQDSRKVVLREIAAKHP